MTRTSDPERPGERSASTEAQLCTCGHVHAAGRKCEAIVSGSPMLTRCVCPGLTVPGQHLSLES